MQKHKKSAFTLLEILIVISITAIVISMGQNINFINLTSFNEKTIHERNKEMIKSLVDYISHRGPKEFIYHLPIELDNSNILPKTWKEKLF